MILILSWEMERIKHRQALMIYQYGPHQLGRWHPRSSVLFVLRASPTRVQQKFANEQHGTKRMFFVVAGRRAKVLK
jgi:hypothetical protein